MKILKNKSFYKLFIIVGIFSGCLNKKKINIINNHKQNSWNYNIGIEGIECKLCAYKAVKRLEKIEDLSDVKMICSPNFRECHANLNLNNINKNINLQAVINAIATEGFEVKYISGNFIGRFDETFDTFNLFDCANLNIKFKNPYYAKASKGGPNENNFVLQANQKIVVDAKLIFQKKLNEIWMTIN
jgi:hypothetical protein